MTATRADVSTLHARLLWLRRRAGLSQATVAAAIGVRVETVSSWEHGRRVPSVEHLRALAEAYCCPPGWIVDGRGPRAGRLRGPAHPRS